MQTPPDVQSIVDLNVLRGWREHRDPRLRGEHSLPPLATLIHLDSNDRPIHRYPIHGDDLLLGRFQPQYAPVDLHFHTLLDHELYRLGAPHARITYQDQSWSLQPLTPRSPTRINDGPVENLRSTFPLRQGDLLTLGVARFRFEDQLTTLEPFLERRRQLYASVSDPALFLLRAGSPCGPRMILPQNTPLLLGRSYPAAGTLPDTAEWPGLPESFWDLSGLFDHERRHISFRHASIALRKGRWTIEPLSRRQRTFVNRIALTSRIPLEPGDELALGSVLFRFHHPHRSISETPPRHVPAVIDWSGE